MKLTKLMVIGSMALVPTLAMGVAQQDPAAPQQLQQDRAAMPATEHEHTGLIMEVRDDSFSLRTDDQGILWFSLSPELKATSASEIVTGNRVTVAGTAGDTPDRMNASRVARAEQIADADADVDIDVDVDDDSVTADVDTDTQIADNDLRNDDTDYDTDEDSDELPRTASSLPAVGSLGLLALLGAAAIGVARRF